ncbi:Zinc finger protein 208 [Nymphon striatum]|nr:Zinc finger protein 208 [Nymphon striatum]
MFTFAGSGNSKVNQCPVCHKVFTHHCTLSRHYRNKHGARQRYECPHCDKTFAWDFALNKHFRESHSKDGMTFKCDFCDQMFMYRRKLENHIRLDTRSRFACSVCHKTFSLLQNMHRHYQNKHCNMGRHGCSFCSKSFTWKTHLTDHVKKMHASQSSAKFKCSVCGALFFIESKMINHMMTHPRKAQRRKFSCPVCGKIFNLSGSMYNHYRNKHSTADRFSCPHCSKEFVWDTTLRKHIKAYHANKCVDMFSCQFCQRRFLTNGHLDQHIKKPIDESVLVLFVAKCSTCLVVCITITETSILTLLGSHAHTALKRLLGIRACRSTLRSITPTCIPSLPRITFSAKFVTESFSWNGVHVPLNYSLYCYAFGSSKHTCTACGKVFSLMSTLSNHFRNKHIDVARKPCPYCSKTFAWDMGLKKHLHAFHSSMLSQLNAYDLQCEICKQQFVFEAKLATHMRKMHPRNRSCRFGQSVDSRDVNAAQTFIKMSLAYVDSSSDEDTFDNYAKAHKRTCPVCGKVFKHAATMSNHRRNKHYDNDRKQCPYCSKTFAWDLNMKTHVKTYHAKEFARTSCKICDTYRRTCPVCGKLFKLVSTMSNHYRNKHVDNERKECPYCSKTFAWDFNMKTHVKTYHAKEFAKTTCTICGRRFVRESELNFHYNKNHPLI